MTFHAVNGNSSVPPGAVRYDRPAAELDAVLKGVATRHTDAAAIATGAPPDTATGHSRAATWRGWVRRADSHGIIFDVLSGVLLVAADGDTDSVSSAWSSSE